MNAVIIPDSENVARAVFSPKMIKDGEIQPEVPILDRRHQADSPT